jgi:hypothetical protein
MTVASDSNPWGTLGDENTIAGATADEVSTAQPGSPQEEVLDDDNMPEEGKTDDDG